VFTARYGLIPCIKQKRLVFITVVESVYSAVRTDFLYKADTFGFYNRGGVFTARYGLISYIKQTRLIFITVVESVYSAVRTESLYKIDTFGFYNRGGKCLQRGTD
jgi:hypothetical protein